MQVDMNGMRLNIARAFNQMMNKLDDGILDDLDFCQMEAIDELRSAIGMSLCVYQDGDQGFRDLSEEIELFELPN
jgi:hypothetical protein